MSDEKDATVKWERFACYCDGTRHYYVREPFGKCPPARVLPPAEEDAPIRVCCGQRHHGPVCPDGLVMCCICFNRVSRDRLHLLEEGDGASVESAPIYEDVCATCRKREERWATHTTPPGSTGETGGQR